MVMEEICPIRTARVHHRLKVISQNTFTLTYVVTN